MPDGSFVDFLAIVGLRFKAHWRLKLTLALLMNAAFWTPYLFLAWHPLFPVHTLPLTPFDKWAGFHPGTWVWAYESAFLLSGIAPWLIESREDVWRYVYGFAVLCVISFVIFALFPVASPRPIALSTYPTTLFLTRWDGPLNAFPSLHAGCLVYVLVTLWKLFGRSCSRVAKLFLLTWASLVLFAALATKQHYAIDLLAGGLLGWAAAVFVWSGSPGVATTSTKTRRNSAVASQAG
jgi:membrane-associated phospholipid phosphatase